MSGIQVQEETIKRYDEMRFKKEEGGLILKINDEFIEIEEEIEGDFNALVAKLPAEEPRYVLYDIPMKNRANLDVVKTSFILWMPMESPVRLRMKYASTKKEINTSFRGIAMQTQADEKTDLTMEKMIAKVNKTQGINNQAL